MRWEDEVLLIQKIESLPQVGKPSGTANTAPYCITVIPKAKKITIIE
jgi:hypothetical protein